MKNNDHANAVAKLRKTRISPSLLAADSLNLKSAIASIEKALDCIHFDVMDGHYVPNLTFGPDILRAVAKNFPQLLLDVHLMVTNPEQTWQLYRSAGAHLISFHPETVFHSDRLIKDIKASGAAAGIALNPGTSLTAISEFVTNADLFLVMSVNPGFGGQSFIPNTLQKISALKELLKAKNSPALIEVDGGITVENVGEIFASGADIVVAGSAVFSANNRLDAIKNLIAR